MAARFAATLRRKLFRGTIFALSSDLQLIYYIAEHLGLIPPQQAVTGREPVTSFMRAPPIPNDDETRSREDAMVADPLSEEMLGLWYTTARVNREVFSSVFRTVPTDNVRNWEQYKVCRLSAADDTLIDSPYSQRYVPQVKTGHIAAELSLYEVKERLSKVRGGLVEAPLNFLIEQKELYGLTEAGLTNPSLVVFL